MSSHSSALLRFRKDIAVFVGVVRSLRVRALLMLFCLFAARPVFAAEAITYTVTPDAAARQFAITLTVTKVNKPTLTVQLPTWSPGSYRIIDFAANVAEVTAENDRGQVLTVAHPDKLTWSVVTGGAKEVRIKYRIANADVVAVEGKPKRAHLSGPRSLMYVADRKKEAVRLILNVPEGWKITNSLDPVPGTKNTYTAPNYDVLADAPSELGDYAEEDFLVRGVPHKVVLYGDYAHVDRAKLTDYCRRVAETEIAFFNDVPFKRYVFQFRVAGPTGTGTGGLEHLGSTEIQTRGAVNDRTRSVIAHEYFHLWNVKRIRPFVLGPFDYTQPNRTANLWWSEGVTSYYGDLLSRRGGLNTDEEYFQHLGTTIATLQNNPARLQVTAEEASQKVWEAGNGQGFGNLSYYTKGELIGLCLDLTIRQETKGKHSLDDVMRGLYAQCGKGDKPGFGEDDIRKTVNRVAGKDLSKLYESLVRKPDEMPFETCLGYAGLSLTKTEQATTLPDTGIGRPIPASGGVRLTTVRPDSPAAAAGLKTGDLVVQVNGKPITDTDFPFPRLRSGDTLTLTVERSGVRSDIAVTVGTLKRILYTVAPNAGATPEQILLRTGWLSGK